LKNKLLKIQNNVVTAVDDSLLLKHNYQCVDSKGNVWFLDMETRELMKYDFVKWQNYGFNKEDYSWGKESDYYFKNHTKFSFIEENDSKVYVFTQYAYQLQVGQKEGGNITWLNRYRLFNQKIPGLNSSKLVLDKKQNPYFLTDSGFFWFDGGNWHVKKLEFKVTDMVFLSDNTPVLSLQSGKDSYLSSEKISFSIAKFVGDTLSFIAKDFETEVDLFTSGKKLYGINQSMLLLINGNKCIRKSVSDLDFFYLSDGIFDKKSSSWYLSTSNGIFQYKNNKINKISLSDSESDEWQFTDYFNDMELYNNTFYAVSSYNSYSFDEASLKDRGGMTYIKGNSVKRVPFANENFLDGSLLCHCNKKLWMHSNGYKASMIFLDTNNDNELDSVSLYSNKATVLDMQCRNGVELYNLYIDGIQIVRNDSVIDYFNDSIPELQGSEMKAMRFDKNGIGWFLTNMGVVKYDEKKWTVIANSPPSNYESDLVIDGQNRIWINAVEGLFMFDGTKWIDLNSQHNLPKFSNLVYAENKIFLNDYGRLIVINLK